MNKDRYISLFYLAILLLTFSCKTLKTEQKSPEITSVISQDKLGNIYQISEMKIVKYSDKLDTLRTNSIFSSGTITSLDTRNPMQLMLFYKQQQEIILLDNTLSETNKIKLNFFEWIDLACMSNRDNAFWLYSITTQSLIKTDKNGKVTNRFNNIGQLVKRDINPTQLLEYNNQVYLFDPNQIVKFYKEKVFFRVKNDIFSYNLIIFDKKLELESDGNFDDFEVGKSGVLVLRSNNIKKAITQ